MKLQIFIALSSKNAASKVVKRMKSIGHEMETIKQVTGLTEKKLKQSNLYSHRQNKSRTHRIAAPNHFKTKRRWTINETRSGDGYRCTVSSKKTGANGSILMDANSQ